ncbi:hypothetical protein PENSPDRAFT_739762 [Peniophora sp. CONT]|nr:hypothetical protein PENSPDRAFT_739762 [Peniophora sp. CONT]
MAQGDGVSARARRRNSSAPRNASERGRSAGQSGARAELATDGEPPNNGPSRSASAPRRSTRLSNQTPHGGASTSSSMPAPSEPRRRTRSVSTRDTPSTISASSSGAAPIAGPSSSSHTSAPLLRTPRKRKDTLNAPGTPKSTPVTAKSDAKLALPAQGERDKHSIYQEHCQLSEGTWIGPVPGLDFLDKCVHDDDPTRAPEALQNVAWEVFEHVPAKNGEAAFFKAIKDSGVYNNLKPLDTHSFRVDDVNDPDNKYGPDIFTVMSTTGLSEKGVLRQATTISEGVIFGDQKQRLEDPCLAIDGTVPLNRGAVSVGEPMVHEQDTEDMRKSRGQLIVYATVMLSNSHRTKVYGFVIMEEQARLLLFDHSGVIYSELFNWKRTGILLAFHARIDAMTPAQFGWDPSVELIRYPQWKESTDVETARKILKDSDILPAGMTVESLFPARGKRGHYSIVHQYNSETRSFHRIVMFKPVEYEDSGLIGSDARWWIAVDLTAGIPVYVKDCWRVDLPGVPSETETYAKLAEAKVPHVLKLHFGDDVLENHDEMYQRFLDSSPEPSSRRLSDEDHAAIKFQKTFTYHFCTDNDYPRNVSNVGEVDNSLLEVLPRTHHRIFFKTIPTKLTKFTSTRQLVEGISHAIVAHQRAYESAGILHRGIDGLSVVFDKTGNGYLVNWERSKLLQELALRMKSRKGNLQWLAADLLQDPHSTHLLRHDLESFVYMLFYMILRYRPITVPQDEPARSDPRTRLLADMRTVFDSGTVNALNLLVSAGRAKTMFLAPHSRYLSAEDLNRFISPLPLLRLMFGLRKFFEDIYLPAPPPIPGATPKELEKHQKEKGRWADKRSKAEKKLTSSAFLKLFTQALSSDRALWPEDDGAIDQYPLLARAPSGGSKAFGGNTANSFLNKLTSAKRPRTYSTGTGSLSQLDMPNKRQRFDDGGSSRREEDGEESGDEGTALNVDARDLWTGQAHC